MEIQSLREVKAGLSRIFNDLPSERSLVIAKKGALLHSDDERELREELHPPLGELGYADYRFNTRESRAFAIHNG